MQIIGVDLHTRQQSVAMLDTDTGEVIEKNVIERCFVEVRRRTRPMVGFTNVESVDRIIYAIFSRFNEDWNNRTLELFTQAA